MEKYCIEVINEIISNCIAFNNVSDDYINYLRQLKEYDFSSIKDNNILNNILSQLNYIKLNIIDNAILGASLNVFEIDFF